MLAPVVVFAYKRDKHLKKVLLALNNNELVGQTDLLVFLDGGKTDQDALKVRAVKGVINEFKKESKFRNTLLYESPCNKGLARSVIGGVSEVINKYGKVIVVEDDLLVSADFLKYMNEGLEYYKNEKKVGAISGFAPNILKKSINSIYKSRTGNSYGWATWKRVWNSVDWEIKDYDTFKKDKKKTKDFNKIQYGISDMLNKQMKGQLDSWAVRWDYFFFKQSLWTIYPRTSKVQNIGFDGEGTTTNNLFDRRKNIVAEAMQYELKAFDDLEDMTKQTARSYKPNIIEKIFDGIKYIIR